MRRHHRLRHLHRLPADHLGAALSEAVVPVLAGLVFGAAILAFLRYRRLRWTWALLIAPFAYLSFPIDWRAGLVLSIATATTVVGGARLDLEARRKGGEEARAAREQVGPLVLVRSLIAERHVRRRRRQGTTLAIGRTRRGAVCRVPFGRAHHGVHSLIVGATGAGKTVTMAALVQAHIAAGQGVIVLDPKGDGGLRRTVAGAATAAGRRFREWSPAGPSVYNPIARGNPTEIADKCLAAHEWSEPHYRTATQRLLGNVLATMKEAGEWPPTLSALVAHMEPERLDALASRLDGGLAERVHDYIDGLDTRRSRDLGGGRDRLAVLVESELGPWLDRALGVGEEIDLAACLDRGEVAYFSFEADRYPEASKLLAAALVIDLAALAAEKQGAGSAGVVLIDEFGALAADHVSRLFARARGAGLSLLLGTQSLADLRASRPDDVTDSLTEQVFSNIAYAVVHRVGHPDAAQMLARLAGTEPAWTRTEQMGGGLLGAPSGAATRTRQRDFIVGVDQFKELDTGQAVVVNPRARRRAEVVSIWPPEPARPTADGTAREGDLRWV